MATPRANAPDLGQMVLSVVLDGEGHPLFTEMLPDNTADNTVLLPAVDRVRSRLRTSGVCLRVRGGGPGLISV